MSKPLKITTLLTALLGILPTLAEYRIHVPIENGQGGPLPNESITFSNSTNPENEQTSPSTNCMFNRGNSIQIFNIPYGPFQAGDKIFTSDYRLVGYYSPSNGRAIPNGLSAGKKQVIRQEFDVFEICADNLEDYPSVSPIIFGEIPPNESRGE